MKSLLDFILDTDFMLTVFSLLFVLTALAGLVFGLFAAINGSKSTAETLPLSTKLLAFCMPLIFISGISATICGYISTFALLGSMHGANKQAVLEVYFGHSNMLAGITLITTFILLFFLLISITLFRKKNNLPLPISKQVTAICIMCLITALGTASALGLIKDVVQLIPGETLSPIAHLAPHILLQLTLYCGCAGGILLFIHLLRTIIRQSQGYKQEQMLNEYEPSSNI